MPTLRYRETVGKATIGYDFKDDTDKTTELLQLNVKAAHRALMEAILITSRMKAPKKTPPSGMLRLTGEVKDEPAPDTMAVIYGDNIAYAAYQERGMRADGSHKVRNYTTPGTGAHYLKNAGDTITKRGIGEFIK